MNKSFFRSTLTITPFAPLARYLIVIPATVAMLVMAAIPGRAAAQEHHHYKLIDLGTFGTKMSLIEASGEEYDVAFSASWINNYDNLAHTGASLPLDTRASQAGIAGSQ